MNLISIERKILIQVQNIIQLLSSTQISIDTDKPSKIFWFDKIYFWRVRPPFQAKILVILFD